MSQRSNQEEAAGCLMIVGLVAIGAGLGAMFGWAGALIGFGAAVLIIGAVS